MGRKPMISREGLLDAAEAIVLREGASALTIEALAQEASISKGGVQYVFASKDALIEALIDRSLPQFDAIFRPEREAGPRALVLDYLRLVRSSSPAVSAKMAGLLITYLQNPTKQAQMRAWYLTAMARLTGATREAHRAREAFLATEGVLNLQMLSVIDDQESQVLLAEIEARLLGDSDQGPQTDTDTSRG